MSNRLRIMAEAEEARLVLEGYDRRDGERRFADLLREHPDDGMISFKRGEAYETIGQPEKAIADYQRAESVFPMREWKQLASQGIDRCKTDIRLGKLERSVRPIWREVVHMPVWPARARPMMARAAVEKTAGVLISELGLTPRGPDLNDRLETLRASRKIDRSVVEDMFTVKGFGDAAAHGDDIGEREATLCDEAARRIVAWLIGRKSQAASSRAV
jgi:tetratricopeptide (TPR) repeat protein